MKKRSRRAGHRRSDKADMAEERERGIAVREEPAVPAKPRFNQLRLPAPTDGSRGALVPVRPQLSIVLDIVLSIALPVVFSKVHSTIAFCIRVRPKSWQAKNVWGRASL